MHSSEEVIQINSALIHCTQLKTHLQGTLMHIQRLNSKYNQTDYMAVVRNLENYRKSSSLTPSSSPYPKVMRQRDHSLTDEGNSDSSNQYNTPVKPRRRPNQIRRMAMNNALTSTPKHRSKSQWNDSLDSEDNDFDDDETPRRSMRQMKTNNNTISVRTIKVQRNIESLITQLQVMQRSQKKRQIQEMERSLFESCCNSSGGSPGVMGHSAYCSINSSFESFITAYGSNDSIHNQSNYHTPNKFKRFDEDQKTLDRVQRFYATPLQQMHRRLINLNASLVSTC